MLYDSKVLEKRISKNKKGVEYLVHFYGWNSSWDRCVAEENILADNAENRALQRQLAEEAAQQIKWKKVKLNKIPAIIKEVIGSSLDGNTQGGSESGGGGGQSDYLSYSGLVGGSYDEETTVFGFDICEAPDKMTEFTWVPFPENLKSVLDKDYTFMTKHPAGYDLPVSTTVVTILNDFEEAVEKGHLSELLPNYSRKSGVTRAFTQTNSRSLSDLQQLVEEFTNSLLIYFDSICISHLLYSSQEKESFIKNSNNKKPSELLGFVHLLRLFIVLPDFLNATSTMSKVHLSHLSGIVENFYFFLGKRIDKYYSSSNLKNISSAKTNGFASSISTNGQASTTKN